MRPPESSDKAPKTIVMPPAVAEEAKIASWFGAVGDIFLMHQNKPEVMAALNRRLAKPGSRNMTED